MPELLDDTDANFLIQYNTGEVDNVAKSKLNRLVHAHDLWGLLKTGDDILVTQSEDDEPEIQVIPDDNAQEYTITIGEYDPVHLGVHQKKDLVDALIEGKLEDGNLRQSLTTLYDSVRDVSVRRRVINPIGEHEPFKSAVEPVEDGWMIHDHLLLTWDRDFYHPGTMSKTRSGSIIGDGSTEKAYQMYYEHKPMSTEMRELTIDGAAYRLSDDEMGFITRAMWAIAAAPNGG